MLQKNKNEALDKIPEFDGNFINPDVYITKIGNGRVGGKAQGLIFIKDVLENNSSLEEFRKEGIKINIPKMVILTTEVFDDFMKENNLFETAYSETSEDSQIGIEFQKASFPVEYIGALRAIVSKINNPLAIRSSSLLEDAMFEPFAGIYGTKMIPNNDFDVDFRFHKLIEAVKFVYSSTFFKDAKDYIAATNSSIKDEKMAVIIQEVVGQKYGSKFYPNISGVARSYNFYPFGHSNPEQGVVNLALGLGKTIVDGNASWTYCPEYPNTPPPANSSQYIFEKSQNKFWAINLSKPIDYDPVKETEYLLNNDIYESEKDGTLDYIASTFDYENDRIIADISRPGPRVLNFASILNYGFIPLNEIIKSVLTISRNAYDKAVEIEFAVTYNSVGKDLRFGFLQVRPMVVSNEEIEITEQDYNSENLFLSCKSSLGNGSINNIYDIVFVKPENFSAQYTPEMVSEIENINKKLLESKTQYLLIGYGRWGSSDSWLGIPVNWGQIAGAKVIVESMLPEMNVELSQGSHFFHNISSFSVLYFSLPYSDIPLIKWDLIKSGEIIADNKFTRHIRLKKALKIKADGKTGKGVILI